MKKSFGTTPLWECNRRLAQVALGEEPADLVIRGARLVNVATGEVLYPADVAVAAGRVAYLGLDGATAEHCVGEGTTVVDAGGRYLTPGLIDGHVHVESSMVGAAEFARAGVARGTTAICWDPHEVANGAGLAGVRTMLADAARTPLKVLVTPPSCVPSAPGFEDSGATIDAAQIAEAVSWDDAVALGELMNYSGLISGDDNLLGEVAATLEAGLPVTGHYPVPECDRNLNAYVASGVSADHESQRPEDVLAKLRLGMYAQLRQGSTGNGLSRVIRAVTEHPVDTRLCMLCSDDSSPRVVLAEGHMDRLARLAVSYGVDPVAAVQMSSLNCATYLHLERELGMVAPGRCADMVLFDDLESFSAHMVFIDGALVAKDGRALFDVPAYAWPEEATHTVHVGQKIEPATFRIPTERPDGPVRVHAIGLVPTDTRMRDLELEVPARGGELLADPAADVLKICVFERHHATPGCARGFVNGFGIHGALAQTVSHDCHNLLVIGDNDEDMALAANALVECGGGEVAVMDGRVLARVELPVFGLISDRPVEEVAAKIERVEAAWAEMGCALPSPFMRLGVICLACAPVLRITNRGYLNCVTYQPVPLEVEEVEEERG